MAGHISSCSSASPNGPRTIDPAKAISDFGALIFLAAGAVTALAYLAKRYEARLLSEADFLRSANATLAAGLERLSDEIKADRERRER